MCLCPRKVRNPSRKFCDGASKTYILVPCGQCEECRALQRQEWFIRAYSEFKECKENRGRVLMITLTYNPNCLPKLDLDAFKLRHGDDKQGVSVFDKKDIDTFRNTLNKKFERKGVTGVRYFIACEYGMSEGSTFRPHYHALVYVPKCKLSDAEVASMVKESWFNGFSYYNPELGPFINDKNGVLYVSKYVTKDLDFFEQGDLKSFLHTKANRKKFYRFMPRHYQSKGFGSHLAKWLLHKEDCFEEFKNGIGSEYMGAGTDRFFQIPRYVMNKLLYRDVNGVRYPSVLGRDILLRLYDYRLELCDRDLRQFFNTVGLKNYIDSSDAYKIIPLHQQLNYENNFNGLRSYLFDLLDNRSIRELSLYKKVFANCTLPPQVTADEIRDFETMSPERLSEFAVCLYDYQLDDTVFDVSETPWKESIDLDSFPTYSNTFKRFNKFDTLLDTIQNIKSLAKSRRYAARKELDQQINRLKNRILR